jgi:hypothetical protein
MPSCRMLPHGSYSLIPAILSSMAWLASLFQDGCDFSKLTGPTVQQLAINPKVPWLEVGLAAYREPYLNTQSGNWEVVYSGACFAYPDDGSVNQDTARHVAVGRLRGAAGRRSPVPELSVVQHLALPLRGKHLRVVLGIQGRHCERRVLDGGGDLGLLSLPRPPGRARRRGVPERSESGLSSRSDRSSERKPARLERRGRTRRRNVSDRGGICLVEHKTAAPRRRV